MKKNILKLSTFAASMLVALSFTACSEEVNTSDNDGLIVTKPTDGTVFSAATMGTRTFIDDNAAFYWQEGDKIYVDEAGDGSFALPSSEMAMNASDNHKTADFYFRQKVLTGTSYDLVYTGTNSTRANEVTIAATQTQNTASGWGDATHLGTSGDCATATATPASGTNRYTFTLNHKAHYLILQPYKASNITDNWKLVSVEIVDAEGETLCGTFPFSMSGLDATGVTNGGTSITLSLTNELSLSTSASGSLYAVILPRSAADGGRRLWVRYNIRPTGSGNGVAGGTVTIMKELSRSFEPNGVTKVQHELGITSYSTNIFYKWDAQEGYYFLRGVANPPTKHLGTATGIPTSTSDPRWQNTTAAAPTQASRAAKDLPSVNMMTWYVLAGDPRYDDGYPFCLNNDYANVFTGGAWYLKKAVIAANRGVTLDYMDSHALKIDGTSDIDGRAHAINDTENYTNNSTEYQTKGRPAATDLGNYFFLPAIGHYNAGLSEYYVGGHGCYYSSSPINGYDGAYYLYMLEDHTGMSWRERTHARAADPNMFK